MSPRDNPIQNRKPGVQLSTLVKDKDHSVNEYSTKKTTSQRTSESKLSSSTLNNVSARNGSVPNIEQHQDQPLASVSSPLSSNPMMGFGATNYYDPYMSGGMYGGGLMGMNNGFMNPMMGGMGMMMGNNNFSSLVFNFQQLVFSASQAIQVVGMNAEVLKQIANSIKDMSITLNESARIFVKEVSNQIASENEKRNMKDTREEKKRRRKLKVIRWSMALVGSYALYRLVKLLFGKRRNHPHMLMNGAHRSTSYTPSRIDSQRYYRS